MTVHIDRAHHHPRVYKRDDSWHTRCPRCGGDLYQGPGDRSTWRFALIVALKHSEVHS
jgi:hypothetical protein